MASAQWWVVNQPSVGPRQAMITDYAVVQSATRPANTVAGPYATRTLAAAWQTSADTAGNSPGSAAGGAVNAALNATGINAIGGFFTALGQAATWIRVAKVIIGGTLLIVGLVHITGAAGAAADAARKVPLPI